MKTRVAREVTKMGEMCCRIVNMERKCSIEVSRHLDTIALGRNESVLEPAYVNWFSASSINNEFLGWFIAAMRYAQAECAAMDINQFQSQPTQEIEL